MFLAASSPVKCTVFTNIEQMEFCAQRNSQAEFSTWLSDCQKRLRRIFRVSGKQSQIVFDRGAPQGGLSCPFGAIHLLYVGENTTQAASVEFVRHKRGPHKARMRFMGRGDAQSQMEFSATREMKYGDWSIDDMRAAGCK